MNTKSSLLLKTSLIFTTAFAMSCGTSGTQTALTKTSLATAPAGDVAVEMFTATQLETGLTPIYLKLADATGQSVTDATVTFLPLMHMSNGVTHTAPVFGPPALDSDGYYTCEAVFQMPTSASGYWDLKVGVERPGAAKTEAIFPSMNVADSGRAASFMYTDPVTSATTKYLVSMNFETAQKVGLNPVIITVHKRQDMMNFPPVDGLTITLDPQMPSMGHGSPGSINPTLVSDGRYSGKLSYSMTGPWETTVTIEKDGVVLGKPVFKTLF